MNEQRRTFLKGAALLAGTLPVSGQSKSTISPAVLAAVQDTAKAFCRKMGTSTATTRELRDLIRASKTLFAHLEEQGGVSTFGVTSAGEDYAPIRTGVVSAGEDYSGIVSAGEDYTGRLRRAVAFRKLLASNGVALDDRAFALLLSIPLGWGSIKFSEHAQGILAAFEAVAAKSDEQNNGRVTAGHDKFAGISCMATVGVGVGVELGLPIALIGMSLLLLSGL